MNFGYAETNFRVIHVSHDKAGIRHIRLAWLMKPVSPNDNFGKVLIQYSDTGKTDWVDGSTLMVIGQTTSRMIRVVKLDFSSTGKDREGWLVPIERDMDNCVMVRFDDTGFMEKVPASEITILGEKLEEE